MLGELVAGQFALESALADVANADPAVRDQLRSQLSQIAGLRQQIGTAQGSGLSLLRGEVTALASNAAATAQEARASGTVNASGADSIVALANTARQQTAAVMAGMKDFDRDLRFTSSEEEAEYRRREAERQAYIAAEHSKGTPQGDLNAAGGAMGQMADAAAHGAADNPAFQKRWNALVDSTAKLRAQIVRDGGNVAEFDDRLRGDLRSIMKSKGLPEARIDALLAAHLDNPLEAVKAYVNEQDVQAIKAERNVEAVVVSTPVATAVATATPSGPMVDAMAKLRASGVLHSEQQSVESPEHGLTAQGTHTEHKLGGRA